MIGCGNDYYVIYEYYLLRIILKYKISTLRISYQHLNFTMKDYQLRCSLAIVTSLDGAASRDSKQLLQVSNNLAGQADLFTR